MRQLLEQFKCQSFLELGTVLTDAEVREYVAAYDRNR